MIFCEVKKGMRHRVGTGEDFTKAFGREAAARGRGDVRYVTRLRRRQEKRSKRVDEDRKAREMVISDDLAKRWSWRSYSDFEIKAAWRKLGHHVRDSTATWTSRGTLSSELIYN